MTAAVSAPAATRPRGVRRWGGYVAVVVIFAVACGLLSWWQWSRRADAVAAIQRVATNWDAPPVPIGQALPALDSWTIDDEWLPVSLHGHYLPAQQLIARSRVLNGVAGFEQLVPFQLDDGRVFVVDRGWLPLGAGIQAPDHVPAPPTGTVDVVVRLKPSEQTLPGRSAPAGQVATIHLPDIATTLGGQVYTGAYGLLASESPGPAEARPAATSKPIADEGPHLSYALQWIAFGIMAFAALFWAVRRERRIAALPVEEQAAARAPRQRRNVDTDTEDAILDRQ